LLPWDWVLADRAKRTPRVVHGKIEWQTINADVQERTDRGAEEQGERTEKELIGRIVHAFS
jgi:hypothetical protein